MRLTARGLNRATLARQLLLERADLDVVEAVDRVVALQGQDPAAPAVALAARVAGLSLAALDAAYDRGALLRSSLMRLTLHVVTAADHPLLRAAMRDALRASRGDDRRFVDDDGARLPSSAADAMLPVLRDLLTVPRTGAEVTAALADRLDVGAARASTLWWALRTYAPVVRAPDDSTWRFPTTDVLFVNAPTADHDDVIDPDDGVRHLVRRYLAGFGPASIADVARFSLLRRGRLREVVATMAGELVTHEGPSGEPLLDVPGAATPDPDAPAPPRLLGMWDSTLLAYEDRGRVLPDEHRAAVVRRNGDTLATVLVDGLVRGVWRQLEDGIEVTPFVPFDDDVWSGLEEEAARLHALLAVRDTATFGRYRRWWDHLPTTGRRVLS